MWVLCYVGGDMSETASLYLLVFVGILFILYILGMIVHYERMIKLKDKQIESLQKDLNSAHAKMMTIDYEKYFEMNIRADAEAAASWREVSRVPEFSDMDIHEPTVEKVKVYGP
jgi:hypothetical protein